MHEVAADKTITSVIRKNPKEPHAHLPNPPRPIQIQCRPPTRRPRPNDLGCTTHNARLRTSPSGQRKVADLGIQQVLTTPLTRAIQTAKLIFDGLAPITIIPDHRELLTDSCDVGSSPAVLRKQFPELLFDGLPDIWWHQRPENNDGVPVEPHDVFRDRIDAFAGRIMALSGQPLAIVGHGNAFKALAGFGMNNCEVRQFKGERPVGPLTFS